MGITGDWDQRITRRTLLKTGGSFAAGITLAGIASGPAFGQASFLDNPFTLGVASGDPSPTGVVLWTRLAPDPLTVGGGVPAEPFEVRYELSQDEDFHAIVRKGSSVALPDEAHSVRAEGYFTPYHEVADAQDIEAVVFLGDYIYEGRNTTIRAHMPQLEVRTLDDYRIRHGQCKTDEGLQKAHAAHPWLITWDDHEFKNNYADEDIDPDPAGGAEAVRARRAAAYRAYWEHMPLARARMPEGPDLQLYRRFTWGKMATFNVLDGRQYRSDQPQTCLRRDASGYLGLDGQRSRAGRAGVRRRQEPHLHLRNNNRGYAKCTLTPDTWTTEYRVVDTVEQPASPCRTLATFVVENGTPGARLAST